jgi:cytochrome c oxidase cbb3-type subunit 3
MQGSLHRQVILAVPVALILSLAWIFHGLAQESTDEATLKLGAQIYLENCAVCHGPDGKGRIGATLAKDWPSVRPDLRIADTIRDGVSGSPMPAWSQANGGPLTDAEIEAVTSYILSWETGGSPLIIPAPTAVPRPIMTPLPNVSGDPNRGALLFDQNCVVCHGPNGEGRIGAPLRKVWASVRPDLEVKAIIQRGIQGSVMPAWGQQNGGPLNEADVNDLVAFVLTLSKSGESSSDLSVQTPASPVAGPQASVVILIVVIVLAIGGSVAASRRKPS